MPSWRHRVRLVSSVLAVAFCALPAGSAPAGSAQPGPPSFASASGKCQPGATLRLQFPTVAVAHDHVIYRIDAGGGSGEIFEALSWNGAATLWEAFDPVAAGSSPFIDVICDGAFSVMATLHDRPVAPVTFAGTTQRSDPNWYHRLIFATAGAGHYVADVSVSGGELDLCVLGMRGCVVPEQTFSSAGTLDLGQLPAGEVRLAVIDRVGPRARYSIAIRPVPVAITHLAFGSAYSRSGSMLMPSFTVDGDTDISARVVDAQGQTVRSLATALRVDTGSHNLTWDGRGEAGAALADGTYKLLVTSRDLNGQTSAAEASITLDDSPPVVTLASAATIAPAQAAAIDVSDAGSGVAMGSVNVWGSPDSRAFAAGGVVTIDAPLSGWKPGTQTLQVDATDRAGNGAITNLTFTVSASAPPAGQLSAADARAHLRQLIAMRARPAYVGAASRTVSCLRRTAVRLRCEFRGALTSSLLVGRGQVYLDRKDGLVHARMKATYRNTPCKRGKPVARGPSCVVQETWRD
jgi:FlgD Ig-like domain